MILLDTNVISEALKPEPSSSVQAWLDAQLAETLFLSSVTIAELAFGIAVLPQGRRRDGLEKALDGVLQLFQSRILTFDLASAQAYGLLAAKARASGLGFPTADGYIAAIASVHRFSVASRDLSAFQAAGLNVINPWQA